MPKIDGHKIHPVSKMIDVATAGRKGASHAHAAYKVTLPDGTEIILSFQTGQRGAGEANGLTNEILLAIVADRLRAFQGGPYACMENDHILMHVEEALNFSMVRANARAAPDLGLPAST
ncbi:hypothetical protein [Aurantimonas sp. 22II-16-19i]|uniref:hypothetical protein n=1 Tax=Aurantimonas sp. 22II-16-19i TaxID=1317114 RepID=UPI0009F7F897|nr:hypothetical protein [Aurantimonas sp. 22II-16-19i]ORE91015.1 hypothetical protein ATO4_20174 [Aurantimonas sp. 22II-16-19i]